MPQEEDEASTTDLRGGKKQRDRDPGSVTQSQRHKKTDLGLMLGFMDYLRNRSLVPEMTRATQRKDTD